jgi:hypothetical protein
MLLSRNPALLFGFLVFWFFGFLVFWFFGYGLWPLTSWRFTHTRPRGNQRLFPLGTPSRPATFSLFTKQQLRKGRHGD